MEKNQGIVVDAIFVRIALGEGTLRDIPVRDVIALVPQDRDVFKEPGNQIDPALIDKQSAVSVVHAIPRQLALPPPKEISGVGCVTQCTKSKIVCACTPDIEFPWQFVISHWRE